MIHIQTFLFQTEKKKKKSNVHYYSQHEFTKLFHEAMHDGTIELEITCIHRQQTEVATFDDVWQTSPLNN